MLNKKFYLIVAMGCLFLPLAAGAVSNATGTPLRIGEIKKGVVSSTVLRAAAKNAIAHCPIVESKIQVKVTNFDNAKVKHMAVYDNLKARLSDFAARFAAKGIDISALQSALQVLDVKIQKFAADYSAYVTVLKTSQEYVCGKSQGDFLAKLKAAKAALAQVHADAADIRAYYASTIKTELLKLKAALKPKATTTPATVSSSAFELPADRVPAVVTPAAQ